MNMTLNRGVTNSAHQIQMTTICHNEPPPWKFSACATDHATEIGNVANAVSACAV